MIKIMQVGYGYWGANVAEKLNASPMFDFCYLAESVKEKADRAKARFPYLTICEDYKSVLNTDIDAVIICTQTEYSYQIAIDSMNAGKHIFIEKPLAKNLQLAEKLAEVARKNKRILHCDHLMVYNPIIRYIKSMIINGELGDIQYFDVVRANLVPIRRDINALLDLAVHDIAVADYLLDGLSPDIVNMVGTKTIGNQDTITYLTMKQGDVLLNINSSWVSPVKVRRTIVAGSQKMCIFDDLCEDKLSIYNRGIEIKQGVEYGMYEYEVRSGDILKPYIQYEDSLSNSVEHFANCVETGQESLSGPSQSLRVMRVLERALQ